MSQPAFRLRAMGVGDLLDETIRLYRKHFVLFISIAAVVYVPVAVLQSLVGMSADPAVQFSGAQLGAMAFASIIFAIGSIVMVGAIIYAISEACLGREITVREAYGRGLNRFWRLLGLGILYGLVVFFLSVTVIGIPFAIYLAVGWTFAYQAIVVEGLSVGQSMGRSKALVKGMWWRTFGVLILVGIFYSIVALVISAVLGAILGGLGAVAGSPALSFVFDLITNAVPSVLVMPILYGAWTLIYYDLRVRKEGFDLEMLAQEIAPTPQPGEGGVKPA